MPRTIIDIPEEQVAELDQLRAKRHVSRATLIREAIASYLTTHHAGLADEAFGIWRDKPVEALSYERKHRSEWPS
jgi:metal-responsive CopG/Arc/MetJ family transcriptional regulator